jgi:hypothetical protein
LSGDVRLERAAEAGQFAFERVSADHLPTALRRSAAGVADRPPTTRIDQEDDVFSTMDTGSDVVARSELRTVGFRFAVPLESVDVPAQQTLPLRCSHSLFRLHDRLLGAIHPSTTPQSQTENLNDDRARSLREPPLGNLCGGRAVPLARSVSLSRPFKVRDESFEPTQRAERDTQPERSALMRRRA